MLYYYIDFLKVNDKYILYFYYVILLFNVYKNPLDKHLENKGVKVSLKVSLMSKFGNVILSTVIGGYFSQCLENKTLVRHCKFLK